MLYFSLTIDGKLVDLYADESLQLTRQVKDYTDIATVFTDFSKSFNIPATDTNNSIFQDFFDENVLLQSWNQNYALDSQIFVHGLPVFNGVVELLEVKFTNGLPSDYSIVFYGQGKNIMVGWGEQTLQEIDWSAFDHTISDAVAVSSWSAGLFSGKVVWDLKDYGYGVTYSNDNTNNNIAKAGGIGFANLRPSILLKEMIQTIFEKQGYELGGTLLARPEFTNLFVTPMNTSGPFVDLQNGTDYGNFEANNTGPQTALSVTNSMKKFPRLPIGNNVTTGNLSGAWSNTNFEYTIPQNGEYWWRIEITGLTANTAIAIYVTLNKKHTGTWFTFKPSGSFIVRLSNLSKGDVFALDYGVSNNGTVNGNINCMKSPATIMPVCIMSDVMPDVKVSDFFASFLKTYNAILIPKSYTSFEIHNLEDWYRSGQNVEYTEWIDFKTLTHKKMPIPSLITMAHEKGETLPQIFFNDSYKRQFGAIEFRPDVDFAENEFKIESKFQVNPPVLIRKTNQSGIVVAETDLEIPAIYDKDAKGVNQKLILFYYNGLKATAYPWYFGATQYNTYPKSSTFSGTTTDSFALSFGLEASFTGDMPKKTLYFQFWNEYISRLYSTRSRVVIVNAVLPVGIWLNMKLNDNIAISGNYYKIQKITYDLLSQKAVIELITYPIVNVLSITSTNGKKPIFNVPADINKNKTFINGTPVKKALGNAVFDGTTFITNGLQINNYNDSMTTQFMNLKNNFAPTISLNKLSLWRTSNVSVVFGTTPIAIPLVESGFDGDNSYYTGDLTNSQITINATGQYRFKSTVILDNTGSHHIGVGIFIDGIETEAYSELHQNGLNSLNISGTSSIGETQVLKLRAFTKDGGSHPINVNRANLIVEKIL